MYPSNFLFLMGLGNILNFLKGFYNKLPCSHHVGLGITNLLDIFSFLKYFKVSLDIVSFCPYIVQCASLKIKTFSYVTIIP